MCLYIAAVASCERVEFFKIKFGIERDLTCLICLNFSHHICLWPTFSHHNLAYASEYISIENFLSFFIHFRACVYTFIKRDILVASIWLFYLFCLSLTHIFIIMLPCHRQYMYTFCLSICHVNDNGFLNHSYEWKLNIRQGAQAQATRTKNIYLFKCETWEKTSNKINMYLVVLSRLYNVRNNFFFSIFF